ncbi:MAG: multicopper oxidase domain-containing protein, partial [Bacteroidia bacterium]
MKTIILYFRIIIVALVVTITKANAQVKLLDPATQQKFVNPLPLPGVAQPDTPGGTHYEISITQFKQDLGLKHPTTGQPLNTTVWGFNGSYPGPTIEARTNKTITVKWVNALRDSNNNPLQHRLPVDTTLHWAKPEGWPLTGVPVVVHVHGGHNESASDGLPESWYTPGFDKTGPTFVKQISTYNNDNQASTVWYHDHALGMTRLNVYMGLAGFYLIRDSVEESLNLPAGDYEIPLAIQDRVFTEDGELFYPTRQDSAGNYITLMKPEMFG